MAQTTKSEVRTQMIFLIANVAAGLLHYLYQVFASRTLSGTDFAELNRWFAGFALFFVIGGILQYAANFFPFPKALLLKVLVTANIICVALAVGWFFTSPQDTLTRGVMVVLGASLFGWLIGQIQARMMFITLAVAQLVAAAGKLAVVLLPLPVDNLEKYRYALFIGYLPAMFLINFLVVKTKSAAPAAQKRKSSWHLWTAPLILSAATAVIPQMDLVLIGHIQSAVVDIEFTRASLFYKAVYFLIFIFAQLFLPYQIAGRWNHLKPAKFLGIAAVLSLIGSAGLALISPFVGQWILGWNELPSTSLVFISCLNMSFLAWLLLLIQEACARSRVHQAGVALSFLAVEIGAQLLWQGSVWNYYSIAIPIQILTVIALAYAVRSAGKTT